MNEIDYRFLKFDCKEGEIPPDGADYSEYLCKMGYVKTFINGAIREITTDGMRALAEYEREQEQIHKQRTEKARDRRWYESENKKLRAATIQGGVLGALTGAVAGAILSIIVNLIMNHK